MIDRCETTDPNEFDADLNEFDADLRIEIDPGLSGYVNGGAPSTEFRIMPPLTDRQHFAATTLVGAESELGQLLRAPVQTNERETKLTVDGETSEEHLQRGIELAEVIITVRGLQGGKVVAAINNKTNTRVVRKLADQSMSVSRQDGQEAGVALLEAATPGTAPVEP